MADTGEFATFAPTVTTFYYVRAENNGCFSNCISTSIDVIPNPSDPQPINTSASVLCFGDSSILSEIGIPAPGSDWYWYTDSCGGTPAGQGNSIIIHPSATTIYYVRAEDSNCNSLCEAVSIIVNPIPPQPVIVLSHDTLIAPLYPSYQWFFGMDSLSFTLAGTDQNQKVAIDGYYFVVITDVNGCTASSDTVLVEDPLSVPERKSDNYLSVYPNPTYDLLNIKLNKSIAADGLINIFDVTGRLVYGSKFSGDKINTISLASFADGMYQVVFSIDGKVFLRKILKQ